MVLRLREASFPRIAQRFGRLAVDVDGEATVINHQARGEKMDEELSRVLTCKWNRNSCDEAYE